MGCLMYERRYRVPLSYDLTPFQILGQKFVQFFVGILVQKHILKLTELYLLGKNFKVNYIST